MKIGIPLSSKILNNFSKLSLLEISLPSDKNLEINTVLEDMEKEVVRMLSENSITPTKIHISKEKEGKDEKGMLEGFRYKKYRGKIRGIKKSLLRKKRWKSDFELYLLYGKDKNGLMFKTMTENQREMRQLGQRLYYRLLESIGREGIIPWSQIVRTGTL